MVRKDRAGRLREARKRAGFDSADQAAKHHDWPQSTYRSHENGTRGFPLERAIEYAVAYDVDPDWLWGGDTKKARRRHIINLPNVSRGSEIPTRRIITRRLNVVGRAVAAATGEDELLEIVEESIEQVACPESLESVTSAYAVYVVGDSMEPRYFAGELLYIHPHKPTAKGNFVLVQIKNPHGTNPLGYVKQFVSLTPTRLVLRQLNPDKEIEFERSEVIAIHRVVGSSER